MKSILCGWLLVVASFVMAGFASAQDAASDLKVVDTPDEIQLSLPHLEAAIRKKGYVSGVKANSLLDRRTGFRDIGFGLDIVDWIMERGATRRIAASSTRNLCTSSATRTTGRPPNGPSKGRKSARRRRCSTRACCGEKTSLAVQQKFNYRTAAPGKNTGSLWEQTLVFPAGSAGSRRWTRSPQRTPATRCSCVSTCRATSSTPKGIRSARCT